MTERSWWWDGHTTGDAATTAPYNGDMWGATHLRMYTPDYDNQGVIGGTLGSLAVTASGTSTVTVASGAAIVYGKIYYNDAPITFPISGNNSYWLIGLAMDRDAQTVRLFARGGYEDETYALASLIHQADYTYWEIPLACVYTTSVGTISSVIDERKFVLRPEKHKEFVPATGCYNYTDTLDVLKFYAEGYELTDSKYMLCYGNLIVPNNFWKLLSVKAIIIPYYGGNIYSRSYIEYGALNDPDYNTYNSHVVSTGFSVAAITANYTNVIDATPAISNLNRGLPNALGDENDFLCLTFVRDSTRSQDTIGHEVYFPGWLVEYEVLH